MAALFGYEVFGGSRQELIAELVDGISKGKVCTIISLNTLKLYQGSRDEQLAKLFKSGTYILPDGQSIALAEWLVHHKRISAISGAELMVELIRMSHLSNYKIFFLGSPESLLQKVRLKIEADYPELTKNIAFQNGYYDKTKENSVIQSIADFEPDFLFVAFGSPRKEEFIIKNQSLLNSKVIMGVGGSFEYFVGDVKLGAFTKKIGLRWLIRTLQDPKRLAKRYAVCNSYFLIALIKEIFKKQPVSNQRTT